MNTARFQLFAPPHTPFDQQGRLALDVVSLQARHYVASAIDGVFVAGSTGEFASLTVDEREQLTERWVAETRTTSLRIIVHVGHNSQRESMRLAEHAASCGVDAIACNAPGYYKPSDVDALIGFLAPVAAAAAPIPFYYYDIPRMTGVDFSIVEVLESATNRIDNLAGIKYTTNDLTLLPTLLAEFSDTLEILFGCDEALLAAVCLGVRGAVGSTYNWASPLYREMLASIENGDWVAARELQLKSIRMIQLLGSFGYLPASKVMMSLLGIDCGPVRSPLTNLSPQQVQSLKVHSHVIDVLSMASNSPSRIHTPE